MQKITIIKRTDGKKCSEEPITEKLIPAKCKKSGVDILIKLVRDSRGWCWKETYNNGTGHGNSAVYSTEELVFDAPQRTDDGFHCKGCGAKEFVKCGECQQLTCWSGIGLFSCAYCGHKGDVSGYMKSIGTLLDGKK